MDLFQRIHDFLAQKTQNIETSDNYCPNCWGRQEYAGKLYQAIEQEAIDLNNITAKKGWIQAYAANHLEGIRLQPKGNALECQTCKVTYRPS